MKTGITGLKVQDEPLKDSIQDQIDLFGKPADWNLPYAIAGQQSPLLIADAIQHTGHELSELKLAS